MFFSVFCRSIRVLQTTTRDTNVEDTKIDRCKSRILTEGLFLIGYDYFPRGEKKNRFPTGRECEPEKTALEREYYRRFSAAVVRFLVGRDGEKNDGGCARRKKKKTFCRTPRRVYGGPGDRVRSNTKIVRRQRGRRIRLVSSSSRTTTAMVTSCFSSAADSSDGPERG